MESLSTAFGYCVEQLKPAPIYFGDNDQFHVHYTPEFKYLGSRLVSTLSDQPEIVVRIRQAQRKSPNSKIFGAAPMTYT